MLELKAATVAQDSVTAQKAAAIGSPLVLFAVKTRGFFDAGSLAVRLLFRSGSFSKDYLADIDAIATTTIQPLHLRKPPIPGPSNPCPLNDVTVLVG